MDALKSLAKGAGITFLGIVASKIISFFYRITLGRGLGPEEYGLIMLAVAVFFFGKKISNLSVNQGIKRYMPVETEAKIKNDYILSAALVSIPLGIFAATTIFLGAEMISVHIFDDPETSTLLKILAPAIPFGILAGILLDSLVAHEKMTYFSLIQHIFQNVTKLVTAILAIALGLGSVGVTLGFSLSVLLTAIVAGFFLFSRVLEFQLTPPTKAKKLISYSWPLFFAGIMTFVLSWTDTLMIGFFLDSAQVGIYNAAFPLAASLMVFMMAVSKVGFPIMSKISEKNSSQLDQFFKTSTRWILTFSTPAFLLLFLFPEEILLLTFGSEYADADTALRILSGGFFISMLVGPTSVLIKATDHTRLTLFNTSLTALGNVLLNIILIPIYGIIGAAIASMVSKIIGNFAAAIEGIILEDVFGLSKSVIPIFLSSTVSLLAVYLGFHLYDPASPLWTLLPGAILYGIIYLLLLIQLGGFKPEDHDIIVGAGRKLGREEEFELLAKHVIR